ncbi:hypothetical protein [Salinibacterium sp. ZJ450]|uniref:hypothetical protein n=1 Tax=Salinibacterium sp. ZJ450 TaxID=2708338 RepID=UPI00141EF7C9|nr:hypothetical protein [Salinibacterium sp. ZJ450]
MTVDQEAPERAIARVVVVVFLIAPLTIWFAGPPLLQADAAEAVCRERATSARAEWVRDPLPHWVCKTRTSIVDDLGWWA